MGSDRETMLVMQVKEAQERHPALELRRRADKGHLIVGTIGFSGTYEEKEIGDEYDLTIDIPPIYPRKPPNVYDFGHQIPQEFDHVFVDTRQLCLGAPVEVNLVFSRRPTLKDFLEQQVEPFLFAATYARETRTLPFGDLAHGAEGLLAYYSSRFGTDELGTMRLLKLLADGKFSHRFRCPCGSENRINRCHGGVLAILMPHLRPGQFARELGAIVRWARTGGRTYPAKTVLPTALWQRRCALARRRALKRRRN